VAIQTLVVFIELLDCFAALAMTILEAACLVRFSYLMTPASRFLANSLL
jgi:hypothetical protein